MQKNICVYCKAKHKLHDLIDLSELAYTDEDKNKLDEEIKNMELKMTNLDKIKQEIINKIDNLKKSSELEMKFIKILLLSYKCEEQQNNLNFNIIQNLKNFEKIFKSNKIDIYDKIYKESKRYLSYLNRYDALCMTHSNLFDFYCVKCKKNICVYCKAKHKLHLF